VELVEEMFESKRWTLPWVAGVRDITNVTNERTVIAAVLPRVGLLQPLNAVTARDARDAVWLVTMLNSFALDYVARQKISGTHLNVTIYAQLPVPSRDECPPLLPALVDAVGLELLYVTNLLSEFAVECGYSGKPFMWNEARRIALRAEADAAAFHAFGLDRGEVEHVMRAFPLVQKKEEAECDEYRSRRLVLERFDAMAESLRGHASYAPDIYPPPHGYLLSMFS
jgi:hypothetical protein